MKVADKLRICNSCLLMAGIAMLASSIQLEATGSRGLLPVWLHVAVGFVFTGLVIWHVYLHFRRSNWFVKFQKLKKPVTRVLWYLFCVTLLLGIVTFIHWLESHHHSIIGGVHGKVGFIMLAFAAGHTIKRMKFFKLRIHK